MELDRLSQEAAAERAAAAARVTELQDRLARRESRPEDVAALAQLRAELFAVEQARAKAMEDLRFYRLELLNREENYNKNFGAGGGVRPSVGLVNPLPGAAAGNPAGKRVGSGAAGGGGGGGVSTAAGYSMAQYGAPGMAGGANMLVAAPGQLPFGAPGKAKR
jgi:hypothetical protein